VFSGAFVRRLLTPSGSDLAAVIQITLHVCPSRRRNIVLNRQLMKKRILRYAYKRPFGSKKYLEDAEAGAYDLVRRFNLSRASTDKN
jgi:hypothetical protein